MGSLPGRSLQQPWIETPLVESSLLSEAAGCRIFLKLENLQPGGSFKSRGIGNLILRALETHPTPDLLHFYSSSGGNAGLACVTAAVALGRPATVVVPRTTKAFMIAKIKAAGATEVIQLGDSWVDADAHLRQILSCDPHGVYVPPFDHPDVWAGAETIVDEVEQQIEGGRPDAMVCSVGGGGLFSGTMMGLEKRWGDEVQVLAVETQGTASLAHSLEKGEPATLPETVITGIATSLAAARVAAKAFELAQKTNVTSVVLTDAEAAMGCWRLADDERLLVEPACGASVAVCYGGRLMKRLPWLTPDSKVVIVICGGSNITLETLVEYRRQYGSFKDNLEGDQR